MASITDSSRKFTARQRPWGRFALVTCGLVFLALGAFLTAALTSHDPGDPSWNQSINAVPKNLMGLAGARIGYGFAHEELIANLMKVKLPFEPGSLAQAAGIGALADKEWLHRTLELNSRGMRFFTKAFRELGLTVVPSEANFLMLVLDTESRAEQLFEDLLRNGIITRHLKSFGLPNCLRVSTGTDEQNQECLAAFERVCRSTVCNSF